MDQKEFVKQLSKAIVEKKLVVGADRSVKLILSKKAKLVAYSNNCPIKEKINKNAARNKIEVYEFPESNVELGELCKKPFRVSVVSIKGE